MSSRRDEVYTFWERERNENRGKFSDGISSCVESYCENCWNLFVNKGLRVKMKIEMRSKNKEEMGG